MAPKQVCHDEFEPTIEAVGKLCRIEVCFELNYLVNIIWYKIATHFKVQLGNQEQVFMSELLSLVINLDGSNKRWADASSQLDAAGLNFERFAAVDARGKDPLDYPEYKLRKAIGFYGRPMTGGEIGCYMSHLLCAKALLDSDCDYAIVLEDDMEIRGNLAAHIAEIPALLDKKAPDWDIVNIGMAAHKLTSSLAHIAGIEVQSAHYFPVTTTGLIWSRKGAAAFWATRAEIYAPVDHYFRKFFTARGTGYALNPPLVTPSGAESEIDAEGHTTTKTRKRLKRTPAYFLREFRRQSTNYRNAWRHLKRHRPTQ